MSSSENNNAASAAAASAASRNDDNNTNNNTNNDELVSNFMAFTGSSDPTRANSYLEMCGGDLQTAVGLYLEHEQGGSESMLGTGGMVGGRGSRTGSAASSTGAVGGGGGGSDGSLGRGLLGDDDWDVRAPDATQTMRLMDDQPHHHHMLMSADSTFHLMNAMMEEQLTQSAFASSPQAAPTGTRRLGVDVRAAINASERAASLQLQRHNDIDDDSDQDYNYDDHDGDDASNGGKNDDDDDDEVQIVPSGGPVAPRLSDMFAAPTHLMHKVGGFAGARASAKDSKRWLLVNIQRDAEFSSHALNRDVWRDELVENLIREGFIFWQAMDQSTEGRTFVERYTVHDYPHISIIDPRTGRLLWRKEGWTQQNPVTAETFAEMAMDFCSRNSLDRPPQAPRPAGTSGVGGGGPAGAARPAQKRPVQEMTEDEQLQAAMRASMDDLSKTAAIDVGDDDDDANGNDDEVQVVEGMEVEEDGKPAARKKAAPSLVDELLSVTVPAEPAAGGSRIQLRMPDGKREVRKFAGADAVKVVYAFVAQSNDEAREGRDFSLLAGFPPSDLIFDLDRTIDECKLAGQVVTVRWKEG